MFAGGSAVEVFLGSLLLMLLPGASLVAILVFLANNIILVSRAAIPAELSACFKLLFYYAADRIRSRHM